MDPLPPTWALETTGASSNSVVHASSVATLDIMTDATPGPRGCQSDTFVCACFDGRNVREAADWGSQRGWSMSPFCYAKRKRYLLAWCTIRVHENVAVRHIVGDRWTDAGAVHRPASRAETTERTSARVD